ncbi:MAG TPA: 4-hydroxythreonine-4-phosphate dehydrogenase PdxA [Bacteroidales bacterium]|nr:4-hydroxythreonine-4-phosphate dehydrogenase PdxA [Bacteroidales bacterium]HQN16394.1 4-hydroxythreonine-4-phosphate dehydrogenase PdxA [Bacteroidales bacterium]HQP16087.1 4-hydroxythreonine-4-phosphate dehydrogenase PdxA [Bacteroidales bacterium]
MGNTKEAEKDRKVVVGITHGDFNGISYEIIIKTLMEPRILEICTPVVYGSSKIASYYRKALNYNDINFNLVKKAELASSKRQNIVNVTEQEVKIDIGESTEIAGKLSLMALDMATSDLKNNNIDVLLTAPINKKNIQSGDFHFKGHTEYLAERFNASNYLMMMVAPDLRIGFVTGHVPIKNISDTLTEELILRKLIVMNNSLIRDFGIDKPKIALLGLNPHSGDSGVIGNEETSVIIPAMKKAQSENILCFGPYPPDGFFGSLKYRQFDGVLAMYHDQGMIAFKIIAFNEGVNYTAGLPVVRTSPAHGVAYDIAGKNIASPESFRNAMYLACDIFTNRNNYDLLKANPLKISSHKQSDTDSEKDN